MSKRTRADDDKATDSMLVRCHKNGVLNECAIREEVAYLRTEIRLLRETPIAEIRSDPTVPGRNPGDFFLCFCVYVFYSPASFMRLATSGSVHVGHSLPVA